MCYDRRRICGDAWVRQGTVSAGLQAESPPISLKAANYKRQLQRVRSSRVTAVASAASSLRERRAGRHPSEDSPRERRCARLNLSAELAKTPAGERLAKRNPIADYACSNALAGASSGRGVRSSPVFTTHPIIARHPRHALSAITIRSPPARHQICAALRPSRRGERSLVSAAVNRRRHIRAPSRLSRRQRR